MKTLLMTTALATMLTFGAQASSYNFGGVYVTDLGTVSSSFVNTLKSPFEQSGAVLQTGQNGSNLSNQGWDPYGPNDTTHNWWNIGEYNGSIGFNVNEGSLYTRPNHSLYVAWGSPSDNNTLTFYSGLNGTGNIVGSVTSNDLTSKFGVLNTNQASNLFHFGTYGRAGEFNSVVFSTLPTSFEFAVNTPEISTWLMMFFGFGLIGLSQYRGRRAHVAD